jgi:hypothetical protein
MSAIINRPGPYSNGIGIVRPGAQRIEAQDAPKRPATRNEGQ